jgi:hypothetical protein
MYHNIQIKFDYGEIDIYRSWIMALFLLEDRDFKGLKCDIYIIDFIKSHTSYFSLGGPEWLNELGSWITNNSYKPITNTAWVHARLCKLEKVDLVITDTPYSKFSSRNL